MRLLLPALSLLLVGCDRPDVGPGSGTPPEKFCPGADGCKKGSDGTFKVGVAAVKITPTNFETPKPEFLEDHGSTCHEWAIKDAMGEPWCGKLKPGSIASCDESRGCRGDFFNDCGRDGKCPGAPGYTGPDADGSEGDGFFQGFWLAGYGSGMPVANVHDDLYARCVVMMNGDVSIGLCSIDAVGIFRDDIERIRASAAKKLPAGAIDYLLISATHTHHGVDTEGQWGPKFGTRGVNDPWLTQVLVEGAARAAADAFTSARPAKFFATQAKLGDKEAVVVNDHRDPWIADDTVTILKFTEKTSGDTIGTLVSWGNHPESLADTNNTISNDYVWEVREAFEKGLFNAAGQQIRPGVGGTCVFMAGSVGGMMTSLGATVPDIDGNPTKDRTIAKAKAVGDVVALAGLDALALAKEIPAPPLAFGATTQLLRVENAIFQLASGQSFFKRKTFEYDATKPISEANYPKVMSEVSKVHVGPVRFIGVPGELFPELAVGYDPYYSFGKPLVHADNPNPPDQSKAPKGPYLKEQLGGDMPCVLGLANDHVGYLMPPYNFQLAASQPYLTEAEGHHYEETNSLGPSCMPTLLEAYGKLLTWEPAK